MAIARTPEALHRVPLQAVDPTVSQPRPPVVPDNARTLSKPSPP